LKIVRLLIDGTEMILIGCHKPRLRLSHKKTIIGARKAFEQQCQKRYNSFQRV
jgi:hypothetical protein